jgi:hypothetical protein
MRDSEKTTGNDRTKPDLFLSYNRLDREAVFTVRGLLQARGISASLDSEDLPLGYPWLIALSNLIQEVRAVVVFIGKAGLSSWQVREISLSLDRQVREERAANQFPVIPILLPEAELEAHMGFLLVNSWVDLRNGLDVSEPLDALVRAVSQSNSQRAPHILSGKHRHFTQRPTP